MEKSHGRDTVYKQYVFSNVKATVGQGWKTYTYEELAAAVGLKPTHNFRKRVQQMAQEGLLKAVPLFTPRGGLSVVFHEPTIEPTETPF